MKKVLVLGGSGLIGRAIIEQLNKSEKFEAYETFYKNSRTPNKNRSFKLDIDDVSSILMEIRPEIIISCLRGDYDKQLNLHTKVAEYLKKNGGKLYFCSTTNVFDNDLSKPHYEDDTTNSCSDYGKYKIECEKNIVEILGHNACIFRLPQVWGKDSPRMKQLIKALTDNEKILVYPKLLISINTDIVIAKKIIYIIEHNLRGIFHLAAEDVINYKDLYKELAIGLGVNNLNMEEDFTEEGCFAILTKRETEFPEKLKLTNKDAIDFLIN